MASEAVVVVLALIGIGVIVVGIMNLMMMQRVASQEVRDPNGAWDRNSWQWRGHYYSHLPVRPILIG